MSTAPAETTPPAELVDKVQSYVSAPANRRAYVEQCTAEALEMLDDLEFIRQPPARTMRRAVLELAAELFHRQKAISGVMTFDNGAEAPLETVRVSADPMRRVMPYLTRYLGPAIA